MEEWLRLRLGVAAWGAVELCGVLGSLEVVGSQIGEIITMCGEGPEANVSYSQFAMPCNAQMNTHDRSIG